MRTPVDLADPVVSGQEDVMSAHAGEMVLFVAGGLLTLMVIGFVGWLMMNAIREERVARDGESHEGGES